MIHAMKRLKRQEVCLLVKTDEVQYSKVDAQEFELMEQRLDQINQLFQMILYVQRNEETSCLKMVHFHSEKVPSEMEANARST